MKRSLQAKLILSYLGLALLTVLVVSILVWLTTNRSFMTLVVEQQTALLSQTVQEYYLSNGSLKGFFEYYTHVNRNQPLPNQPGGALPQEREPRGVQGLVDAQYRALLPTFGFGVGEIVPAVRIKDPVAVEVGGQTIAWILPDTSRQFTLSPEEQYYRQRTILAIGLAALAGMLAAVVIGALLSGRLLIPIRRLSKASRALSQGDLDQQIPVTSQDELGQLTATFNQMSKDLSRADQRRKRLTADISHDLGTPLQIISGYVEMAEKGEAKLTAKRLGIIRDEVDHLRRLVGDLNLLTQAEGGGLDIQISQVAPGEILERVYRTYKPICAREGVTLELQVADGVPAIRVDEGRMIQVFNNLMENALRHTPQDGRILLTVEGGARIQMKVSDSGSGIDAEDLPYVFDRFYRSDKARSGATGKMGLGLAICKALVVAQGGTIAASSTGRGQGTTVTVSFNPGGSKDIK